MFVLIHGSISPVRIGPVGTDPTEIFISPVTYIYILRLDNSAAFMQGV